MMFTGATTLVEYLELFTGPHTLAVTPPFHHFPFHMENILGYNSKRKRETVKERGHYGNNLESNQNVKVIHILLLVTKNGTSC